MSITLILLGLAAMTLLALLLRYAIPKIELRGHSESHNGVRVQELALTWLRGEPASTAPNQRRLECAVYVTLKRCN
jgi:hypothetical protein